MFPWPECARCIELQKRYEEALVEEMGALLTRENALTSAEELAAQRASRACIEARNALAHHILPKRKPPRDPQREAFLKSLAPPLRRTLAPLEHGCRPTCRSKYMKFL
jgi:hypothetical protein